MRAIVAIDILRGHRQQMGVMNFVWVLTPLYSGLVGLWAYYQLGRPISQPTGKKLTAMAADHQDGHPMAMSPQQPFWQSVALGAMHCGSGCTLGDLLAETFVLYVPLVLFGHAIGAWALDFAVAFLIGIVSTTPSRPCAT